MLLEETVGEELKSVCVYVIAHLTSSLGLL